MEYIHIQIASDCIEVLLDDTKVGIISNTLWRLKANFDKKEKQNSFYFVKAHSSHFSTIDIKTRKDWYLPFIKGDYDKI